MSDKYLRFIVQENVLISLLPVNDRLAEYRLTVIFPQHFEIVFWQVLVLMLCYQYSCAFVDNLYFLLDIL